MKPISLVYVVYNKALNENVASAYRDLDNLDQTTPIVKRLMDDYADTGCQVTVTVSRFVRPNADFEVVKKLVINGSWVYD
jgi:hypothetical protein